MSAVRRAPTDRASNAARVGRSGGRGAVLGASLGLALLLPAPVTAAEAPAIGHAPAETCVPARVPFDAADIRLTGMWSGTDTGIYYIRQDRDTVWWNGMSGIDGAAANVGREFNNVGLGTLRDDVLVMQYSDVPRGNVGGSGSVTFRVEGDDDGDLILRRESGDLGASVMTPCQPRIQQVARFARPFSFSTPFGAATAAFQPATDLYVIISADVPESGLSAWVLGPGWQRHCSSPPGPLELRDGPEGLVAALRAIPGLAVGDPVPVSVDGRPALSVEVGTGDGAVACPEDGAVRLWRASDDEASLHPGDTLRVVAVEASDATVAFEIWGPAPETWEPQAQAILDTLRFEEALFPTEAIGLPADDGARIVRVDVLDDRARDLMIESPSVGYATVRLLLPGGFEPGGEEAWPSLWLLHGAWDDYTSWTRETDVEALTADADVLVVMPEAGEGGLYSDWWNGGLGGQPAWETFHLEELPQLLERNWQAGPSRAVAGLSMGGLGAMSYAARRPGMFTAAASFSGVLDTLGSDLEAGAVWGDKTADRERWEEHDPVSLAERLTGVPLYVSWGDGQPGPLDGPDVPFDGLEAWVAPQNEAFVARLEDLGIDATVSSYGAGTHSWAYWERALHEALPMLLEALEGRRNSAMEQTVRRIR